MTRILIVEDEPSIATALEDALRLEGYEVHVVGDGLSAERASLRDHYDLILPADRLQDVPREQRSLALRAQVPEGDVVRRAAPRALLGQPSALGSAPGCTSR